jgi:hypothetical protein
MKNECNIINDLLPLYIENLISEETRVFVDKHLESCTECKKSLTDMKPLTNISSDFSATPLKNIKKKLLQKRIATIVLTATLVLAILIAVFSFLTAPQYLPLSDKLLAISEIENGTIIITFSSDVTGYRIHRYTLEDTEANIYSISAWNSIWDKYISSRGNQNAIIGTASDKASAIYYSPNNSMEDVLIYGTDPYPAMGITPLPRKILTYYLILVALVSVVLLVLRGLLRNKATIKIWIERILPFPLSYILASFLIKGFAMSTYSSQRYFSIILIVTILLYIAALLGVQLYRSKKEDEETKNFGGN